MPILFLSNPVSALLNTSFSFSSELANCMLDCLSDFASVTRDVVRRSWSRVADSRTCSVDRGCPEALGFEELLLPNRAVVVAVSGAALLFVAFVLLRRVEARSCAACCGDVRLGSLSIVSDVATAGANSLGRWASSSSSSDSDSEESSWRAASWFSSSRRVFKRFMRSRFEARSF